MRVIEELARLSPDRDMIITIGVFDGVHLGHRQLIRAVAERANEQHCLGGVITFHPHPRLVLSPSIQANYLTSVAERQQLISEMGIDVIATLTFTTELARLSAEEFVGHVQEHLGMRELFVGWDFALGRNRQGNEAALREIGLRRGFSVHNVPRLVLNGETVSSTAIRQALADGDLGRANRFLGRHFGVQGSVVHGAELGRTIGFPTANLGVDREQALPKDGVYVTRAYVAGRRYDAVTNIGRRPTFNFGDRSVEIHLLDFDGDIYGEEMRIELLQYLRGEVKFSGPDELRAQINRDVAQARAILAANLIDVLEQ